MLSKGQKTGVRIRDEGRNKNTALEEGGDSFITCCELLSSKWGLQLEYPPTTASQGDKTIQNYMEHQYFVITNYILLPVLAK